MIECILPNFYRIEIPLPDSPLKSINSYLIKGGQRFLLVDTGMNRTECLDIMLTSLKTLEVDLERTDLVLTHFHIDHSGLIGELAAKNSRIYCSEADASILSEMMTHDQGQRLNERSAFYTKNGFPEEIFKEMFSQKAGYRFKPGQQIQFTMLHDGDSLDIGSYSFKCILTPGHTPGHICLYEVNNRVLLSGDHVLFDISPNIICYRELENSLKAYLTSLDKISTLNVALVLPGHRGKSNDLKKRIRELQDHHQSRLDEVVSILHESSKTAWEVASKLIWGLNERSWEFFPIMQKWFALGETIAHLKFLVADNRAEEMMYNGKAVYSAKSTTSFDDV